MNNHDILDFTKEEDGGTTFSYFIEGLSALWSILGEEKKTLVWVTVMIAGLQLLDLMFPFLLKILFESFEQIQAEYETGVVSPSTVALLVGLFVSRWLSQYLSHFVKEPVFIKSLIRLENTWPRQAQEKLLSLSLGFHEVQNTGKKADKVNKGIEKSIGALMELGWHLLPQLFYLLANIVVLLFIDWRLGLVFLAPVVPAVIINLKAYERLTPYWNTWDRWKEESNGNIVESLMNVHTVQHCVTEEYECERVKKVRDKMIDVDNFVSMEIQKYFFSIGFILHLFFVFTILLGVYLFVQKEVSGGSLVYVIATGNVTIQGVWSIVHSYAHIMKNLVSSIRMYRLMTVNDRVPSDGTKMPQSTHEHIELRNVSFDHGSQRVVRNLSLTIEPGEMVAFVGKSGAGKTTLARLISRTYDVSSGSILYGKEDIKDINRDTYRRMFAFVKQDVDIFDGTLRHNVCYGVSKASEHTVERALRAANLHDDICDSRKFPEGVDTLVGERGVRLSGGERQRVGIARAYLAVLHGARVLVLDEATSSLDSKSERMIQQVIGEMRSSFQVTIIAIAHRLSTIQIADHIYVLEDGMVIEAGDHQKLLRKNGLYAELVYLQQLGELEQ